jgi:hypothetical protein
LRSEYETKTNYSALDNGNYGYKIDVAYRGLLYTLPDWEQKLDDINALSDQFAKTKTVLYNLYTAEKYKPQVVRDILRCAENHVSDIKIEVESSFFVPNIIWEHLNSKRQPAVIVVDLNAVSRILYPDDPIYDFAFLAHYCLVAGIRDTKGYKEFYIYDPWYKHRKFWASEEQLKEIMTIPTHLWIPASAQPYLVWLGRYLYHKKAYVNDGCYYGLVEGD